MSEMSPGETGDLSHELVRLASADNFRDLAGPGHRTADGTPLRPGVLYRSNELQLSEADVHRLAGLGLGEIFDLREQHEVDAHPDIEVSGASWHHLPVPGIPMDQVVALSSREEADEAMRAVYRGFVDDELARVSFAELLTRLAAGAAPQVFHCTAGKDRTGWASALLLRLAGVPEETVLADYLRTNEVNGTREKYLAMVAEHLGPEKVPVYESIMVAEADYLAAADERVRAEHGDHATYAVEGLGLSRETVAALVARLR